MAKIDSKRSWRVSPIPIKIPVVNGIPNSPANSIVRSLTRGRLLGANSCGPPGPWSPSLALSSISPIDGLYGCSAASSRRLSVPGFAWGNADVSSVTSLHISARYCSVVA